MTGCDSADTRTRGKTQVPHCRGWVVIKRPKVAMASNLQHEQDCGSAIGVGCRRTFTHAWHEQAAQQPPARHLRVGAWLLPQHGAST
eukprot:366227-Chlamydomonas_euryale.AAC.2